MVAVHLSSQVSIRHFKKRYDRPPLVAAAPHLVPDSARVVQVDLAQVPACYAMPIRCRELWLVGNEIGTG